MVHVGIDLAWNTNARTGLAVVDDSGSLFESSSVRTDDEIDAWLGKFEPGLVSVAIDAPLIVRNATGMRPAEKLISAAFGRYDASCHASNTSKTYMNPPRATTLAARHDWDLDPAHQSSALSPGCIEVYPHPATIGLFGLGRILKYKGGDRAARQAAFVELLDHMESIDVLGLRRNSHWRGLRRTATGSSRQVDLDVVEDEVDAILCAHLAWLWHTNREALQVYGDVETGYIVAPPPPSHTPTPRALREPAQRHTAPVAPSVAFIVTETPATFATRGEWAWRDAVSTVATVAMGEREPFTGRLEVEVDFVLPAPTMKGQGWDLDNLVKPTIDALGPVIGMRPVGGKPQVDDERVDRIVATKRGATAGEATGATITVRVIG